MGYLHIDNLYKNQDVLLFRKCYALEKVHGTSAHVEWSEGRLSFFSGGEEHLRFKKLFDEGGLAARFAAMDRAEVTVFGEAYGGKQQGMSGVYGKELRFIAFDVRIHDTWVGVDGAAQIASDLGLEFVDFALVPTDIDALNAERDRPSVQAIRNGVGDDKPREGVVLRPPIEVIKNNGQRIIAKHKRDDFSERATPQKIDDPEKLAVLAEAEAIAAEWVTEMRLSHVLDKLGPIGIEHTKRVVVAMIEDVQREAAGEIVASRAAERAIGKRAADMFKARLKEKLREVAP